MANYPYGVARDRYSKPLNKAQFESLMTEAEVYIRSALVISEEAERHCEKSYFSAYAAVMTSVTTLKSFEFTKELLKNVPRQYYSVAYCSLVRQLFNSAGTSYVLAVASHPSLDDKLPMSEPKTPQFFRDQLSSDAIVGNDYPA
jgi:hypothetical protein